MAGLEFFWGGGGGGGEVEFECPLIILITLTFLYCKVPTVATLITSGNSSLIWGSLLSGYITTQYNSLLTLLWWGCSVTMQDK